MAHPDLRLAAALYALHGASADDLRRTADAALCRGEYTYSLGELGTLRDPILADAGPLFEAALDELGLALPAADAATQFLVRRAIRALAEGVAAPREWLGRLAWLVFGPPGARPSFPDAGAREIAEHYYYLDFPDDPDAVGHVVRRTADLARAWAAADARPVVSPAVLRWGGGTVPAIARHVAAAGAFHDLPILADALEDAGCADDDILDHCRADEPHGRACWVVDAIVGAG